jgi:hypothetical protein
MCALGDYQSICSPQVNVFNSFLELTAWTSGLPFISTDEGVNNMDAASELGYQGTSISILMREHVFPDAPHSSYYDDLHTWTHASLPKTATATFL